MTPLPFSIRPVCPDDLNLITDSWIKAYLCKSAKSPHGQAPLFRMHPSDYVSGQRALCTGLLDRSTTLVACNNEFQDQIYGWVCVEQQHILHFVDVSKIWRQMGIATALMKKTIPCFGKDEFYYTHFTPWMAWLGPKWKARYNPYLTASR